MRDLHPSHQQLVRMSWILALAMLTACQNAGDGNKRPEPAIAGAPASGPDVLIATIGPMSGGDGILGPHGGIFGEQMRRGLQMAVRDVNAAGGVMGRRLRAVVEDDGCDPRQARAAAEKVATMRVAVVVGHFCSSSSIPASEVYADARILQISPASTNPRLTDDATRKGWIHVHRVAGRDDQQGEVAGDYLARTFRGGKVVILHERATFGLGVAKVAIRAMENAGLKPAMSETFNRGDRDFTALIARLRSAGMDAVFVASYHTEVAQLVRQGAAQGFRPQWVATDALATPEFWTIAGPAAAGVLMTFPPDPRKADAAKEVVKRFLSERYDPEGYTLYTYAAVQVWADAVKRAGSMDMAAVSAAMRGGTFQTVLGPLGFDAKGDPVGKSYVLYRWRGDGQYEEFSAR